MNKFRYFISFIEEAVMNPHYEGYIAGRLEIYDREDTSGHASEEIRFFTKDPGFYDFRDKWDFKKIHGNRLNWLRRFIRQKYHDKVE